MTAIAEKHFNISYLFPYQRLVISNILEAAGVPGFVPESASDPVTGERDEVDFRAHQIVILPTGAGKSLCFMLPALMLDGPTLVVFPLLSLIADQARRLVKAGMKPGILRGGQSAAEREAVFAGAMSGEIKMILTNPETALNPKVLEKLTDLGIRHLVIDETHTVSEWGESFRPVYLEIGRIAAEAGIPVVTAFTATASPLILEKVKDIIFPGLSPNIISANPDRPNISYRVIPVLSRMRRLALLLNGDPASGTAPVTRPVIIFCGSRRTTELLAVSLRERLQTDRVYFYHAGLSREEKKSIEEWFFGSEDGILVATCAYGMGVDKSGIRTVIHAYVPPSVEAYLQESGRAGRDRDPAEAVLLFSPEDGMKAREPGEDYYRRRYRALAGIARSPGICRRAYLLKLMGAPETACSGCDVCSGTIRDKADGYGEILAFFRLNPGMFTRSEGARMLKGKSPVGPFGPPPFLIPGFGSLEDWEEEDILEAMDMCINAGFLGTGRWGHGKRKISPRFRTGVPGGKSRGSV